MSKIDLIEGSDHAKQPPAFPCGPAELTGPDGEKHILFSPGMSLRDWFAGQALASDWSGDYSPMQAAEHAYKYADAMLAERNKGGTK